MNAVEVRYLNSAQQDLLDSLEFLAAKESPQCARDVFGKIRSLCDGLECFRIADTFLRNWQKWEAISFCNFILNRIGSSLRFAIVLCIFTSSVMSGVICSRYSKNDY